MVIHNMSNAKQQYNVFLHGTKPTKTESMQEVAELIMKEGLNIPSSNSVLSTLVSIGKLPETEKEVFGRHIHSIGPDDTFVNIIIATPNIIESEDKRYILGAPPITWDSAGNQYEETCILDHLCCKLLAGKLPKEFVHGYAVCEMVKCQKDDVVKKIILNPSRYSNLSSGEKAQLDSKLIGLLEKSNMKSINELLQLDDINKIQSMLDIFGDVGLSSWYTRAMSEQVQTKKFNCARNGAPVCAIVEPVVRRNYFWHEILLDDL